MEDPAEYVKHLTEQIGFLLRSARAFDDGDQPEAKRLATSIRTLVHKSDTSHALLDQCGVLQTMDFGDTSQPVDPDNMLSTPGLVGMMTTSEGWRYAPSQRPVQRWTPFRVWWREPVLYAKGRKLSRRDLVLDVANTDGGTHVAKRKPRYEQLSRQNLLGWTGQRGDDEYSLGNPALAAVRQITFETLASIEREFPGLIEGRPDIDRGEN